MELALALIKNKETNKFEDRTDDIEYIIKGNNNYTVKFRGKESIYTYLSSNIHIEEKAKIIDIKSKVVYINNIVTNNIQYVEKFKSLYRITINNRRKLFKIDNVRITDELSGKNDKISVLNYFKSILSFELEKESVSEIMLKYYENLSFINHDSVYTKILYNGKIKYIEQNKDIIYPI